jgi:hypothetical protein
MSKSGLDRLGSENVGKVCVIQLDKEEQTHVPPLSCLLWACGPGQQLLGIHFWVTLSVFLTSSTGVISEQGLREEVPPILQHHMLKVALELPANKFLWLKAQVGSLDLQSSVIL